MWNVDPSKEEIGVLMEAGIIYRDLRNFEAAREVFSGVQALLPKSDAPHVALGTVSFKEGDFEGADRHYRLALEVNPRSAYAFAHLAELEAMRGNSDKARQHVQEAIKLDPRGPFGKMARSLLNFIEAMQSESGSR
jgi:tetratricopeptide (TPR) repeat protein